MNEGKQHAAWLPVKLRPQSFVDKGERYDGPKLFYTNNRMKCFNSQHDKRETMSRDNN